MQSEILREINLIHKNISDKRQYRYSKELKDKILLYYKTSGLSVNKVSELFGISPQVLYVLLKEKLFTKKTKHKRTKDSSLFSRVEIVPDKNILFNSIDIISPSGYVIKDLGLIDAIKLLKGLHA